MLMMLAGCIGRRPRPPAQSSASAVPSATAESHGADAAFVVPITAAGAQAFAGDASCVPCHPGVCREFATTGHAATLKRVDDSSFGRLFHASEELRDRVIGFTYRPRVDGRRCMVVCDGPGGEIRAAADLAVGRGQNGITFLGHVATDSWATLRISYYAVNKRWMFSPGQSPGDPYALPVGQRLSQGDVAACLSCHVTYLRETGGQLDIGSSHLGVGCERCHGAGRRHVETARAMAAGAATSIAPLDRGPLHEPARVEALCAPCHSAPEESSHSSTVGGLHELARFEATGLEASRCYRESIGLTCVTCHDPHRDAGLARSATDAICRRCHGGAIAAATRPPGALYGAGKLCPVNKTEGCVRCHMPATRFETVLSQPFHNHLIRVWKGSPLVTRPHGT